MIYPVSIAYLDRYDKLSCSILNHNTVKYCTVFESSYPYNKHRFLARCDRYKLTPPSCLFLISSTIVYDIVRSYVSSTAITKLIIIIIIIIISCARGDTICPRPLYGGRYGPAAAHPFRLRRPARLASNSCGLHEY